MELHIGDKVEIIHTKKSLADHMLKGEQGLLGRLDQAKEGKPDIIFLDDGDGCELLKHLIVRRVETTVNLVEDLG